MFPKSKTKLSKEDKDARNFIVRNVANDMFSLIQGPRSHYYGVIGCERRKARNIYPWLTDGMLDHQLKKLKKSHKRGVAIRELQMNAAVEDPAQELVSHHLPVVVAQEGGVLRTAGRPTGSTVDALKTLDDRKRKAFDDAAAIYSKVKMTNKLPHGGFNQIIQRAKVRNGLENQKNWTISVHSVRSRHRNNCRLSNGVVRCGPTSPLAPV
jgi:hypothetical protein